MTIKIAINGFGRIGRLVLRAWRNHQYYHNIDLVAVNELYDLKHCAHLLKYDTIHGQFNDFTVQPDGLMIDGQFVRFITEADMCPWGKLGVDLVLDCTGRFTERARALTHLAAGAQRVLISAPAVDPDFTVVYGVNHQKLRPEHKIISNGSCTTNALAPVAAIAHAVCEIEAGFMTTIHAYTGDQRVVDSFHADLYRARAAGCSAIPTSTGAAKAIGLILPELQGKIDGTSIRVPLPNVSLIDFKFNGRVAVSAAELNQAFAAAAQTQLQGVMAYNEEPLVSSDFNHNPHSVIVDGTQTKVVNERFYRVLGWYDNEWGFANRMIDMVAYLGQQYG